MTAIERIAQAIAGLERIRVVREAPQRIVNASDLPLAYITVDSIETRRISFDTSIDRTSARLTVIVAPVVMAEARTVQRVREITAIVKEALDGVPDIDTYLSYSVRHVTVEIAGIQYLAAVFDITAVEEEVIA